MPSSLPLVYSVSLPLFVSHRQRPDPDRDHEDYRFQFLVVDRKKECLEHFTQNPHEIISEDEEVHHGRG